MEFELACRSLAGALCALGGRVSRKQGKSGVVVALEDVVAEMDLPNDSWSAYLNRQTGQLITLTDDDGTLVDGQPEPQPEDPSQVPEMLESNDWVALPDKFDIHEYRIMERFSLGVEDIEVREALLQAIRGRGAFRRFKEVIHERGVAEAWHAYRQQSFEAIAVEWLEANGIPYRRGERSRSDDGA